MGDPGTIDTERTDRRGARVHRAVLAAAWDLVAEGGYPAATVEAIAARARVGKPTIYRRWPNRAAVVMDALLAQSGAVLPFPDTGSAREDFRRHLLVAAAALPAHPVGTALAGLIGEAQQDPALAAAIARDFIAPLRRSARTLIQRGIARGELRADLDPAVVLDALFGPLYYRLLVSRDQLDARFVESLIDHVFHALTSPPEAAALVGEETNALAAERNEAPFRRHE